MSAWPTSAAAFDRCIAASCLRIRVERAPEQSAAAPGRRFPLPSGSPLEYFFLQTHEFQLCPSWPFSVALVAVRVGLHITTAPVTFGSAALGLPSASKM